MAQEKKPEGKMDMQAMMDGYKKLWIVVIPALQPRAGHAVAGSTLKHGCALVFSAYGRKPKPPAVQAVVDASMIRSPVEGF